MRDYTLNDNGLQCISKIEFQGLPIHILSDQDREALIVEQYSSAYHGTVGFTILKLEETGWTTHPLKLPEDCNIEIKCLAKMDEMTITIADWKSRDLIIFEYY